MRIPSVAIVGRPNVGKSTLFNRLVGRRVAIVEPTAGVTRDRVLERVDLEGRAIEIMDTGGIGIVDADQLAPHIERQIALALESADVVLFVVDAIAGLTPLDREVAGRLRKLGRPVVLCANKVDDAKHEPLAHDFYALGLGEPLMCSAAHGFGRTDLVERLLSLLPEQDELAAAQTAEVQGEELLKLAIVGRRNVGKSTFVNALASEERVIASEHPGTTRDAIDVRIEHPKGAFIVIDTAGMRRKKSVESAIELFSHARTDQSIDRANVVVLMFDVSESLSQVDKQLAQAIEDRFKPCVIVGNKWDLARAEDLATDDYRKYLDAELPGLAHCPLVFTTATEDKGVWSVIQVARELHQQASTEIPTAKLNRVIEEAMRQLRPRIKKTVPKIYYATQQGTHPVRIILQVNKPTFFDDAYRRYLRNRIREEFGLAEVPLDMIFRERPTQYKNEERGARRRKLKDRARAETRRTRRDDKGK